MNDKIRNKVIRRDVGFCQYCGCDMTTSYAVFGMCEIDHVRSRKIGGTDDLDNLRLACSSCNKMLARHGRLTTFEARREHIQTRLQSDKLDWFPRVQTEIRELRKKAAKKQ